MDLGKYGWKENFTGIIHMISKINHQLYRLIHTENLKLTKVLVTKTYAYNYEVMDTSMKFLIEKRTLLLPTLFVSIFSYIQGKESQVWLQCYIRLGKFV